MMRNLKDFEGVYNVEKERLLEDFPNINEDDADCILCQLVWAEESRDYSRENCTCNLFKTEQQKWTIIQLYLIAMRNRLISTTVS